MTTPPVRLAYDCALLPERAGYVVFLGSKGRAFRVKPHIGRWLLDGANPQEGSVSEADKNALLELGALTTGAGKAGLPLNAIAPKGVAGWATLSLLLAAGVISWASVSSGLSGITGMITDTLRDWTTWVVLPVAAVLLTLWHEWGHVLVLGALGGRAGHVQVRFGWPWAVTVVGPFRDALNYGQQILLVAGGVLVEFSLLGVGLVGLKLLGPQPVLTGWAITAVVYLGFNLFPTPWSDGGQLVLIAFRCVRNLIARRAGHD